MTRAARALALALTAWAFITLAWLAWRRLGHPFDLEWLEGATLWHAQRILDGQPLYPPPSIDFVPHPYTPLYPALLALWGRLFGVSYALARALSLASFLGALAVGWRFVRNAGGSRALATAAMAIPCAAFVPTGAWIDLARVDSLWLLLSAAGATLAWQARAARPASTAALATAAALMVAAFFTKQTAAPLMLAVALALALADRRAALVFVAGLALFGLPSLWAMQRASGGWFWFYIFGVHHSHAWSAALAAMVPGRLAQLLFPGVVLAAWALLRDRSSTTRYAAWLAAVGVASSAVAKGTAGAYTNALLPGVYFGALFIGVAAARLVDGESRRSAVAWLLVAGTLATAPGGIPRALQRLFPWRYHVLQHTGYLPTDFVPGADDRARDQKLVDRIRATPGAVWLPSRPWYAHLAGKRPLAGEMAWLDLAPTGVPIAGFDDALRTGRFAAVILDDPYAPALEPLVARSTVERIEGPPDVVGMRRLWWWLTPR